MTTPLAHPLVSAYLRDLELLLHGVEPVERAEVLGGVHEHLEASLEPGASEVDVRAVLAELGSPHSVADEAYAGRPPHPATSPQRPSIWPPITATAINAGSVLFMVLPVVFGPAQASAIAFSFVAFLLPWTAVCALTGVTSQWDGREKLTSLLILPGSLAAHTAVVAIALATIGPHIINLVPTLLITAAALWMLVKLGRSARG